MFEGDLFSQLYSLWAVVCKVSRRLRKVELATRGRHMAT